MDHISPAPLPSLVSVRRPYNGVKGAKRFPHSLADAINTALTTVHSADGKIPSGFITISLVSLRSPSLQAYYWKKCCFNKEQFQGWSTATNHRLGSLIYKSLVSERDAAECQVFTLLKALYDPLDQTPAAPGQRRIQGCLGKDPACISTGEVHVCVYIDARPQRRRGLQDEFLHFRRRFHLTATSLNPKTPGGLWRFLGNTP